MDDALKDDILVDEDDRKARLTDKLITEFMNGEMDEYPELIDEFHAWLVRPGQEEAKDAALFRVFCEIMDEADESPTPEEVSSELAALKKRLGLK